MPTITRQNAAAFRRPLVRPDPVGPVQAYKTYAIAAPPSTHWRTATCAEVDCAAHRNGWRTAVDVSTDLGVRQADYIRYAAGRAHREERTGPTTVTFTFAPGQRCFTKHRVRLQRPALYVVRGGDHRGATTAAQRLRGDQWIDSMQNNFDQLRRTVGAGR